MLTKSESQLAIVKPIGVLERLSIELTNQCQKGCWFCYNHSQPGGPTHWTVNELVELVSDCCRNGTQAVSWGGGEPLEFPGLFELLERTKGMLFRSMTTNGLMLDEHLAKLVKARPDKVHLSLHFPGNAKERHRVIRQVNQLLELGISAGVNLLVARSQLDLAAHAARELWLAGIENDRIVYLPMRGSDTPTPRQLSRVAGSMNFQSMTCLNRCGNSPRFCSIAWDRSVAWCSYTTSRRRLESLTYRGLEMALENLGLEFCGNDEDE